VDNFVFFRFPLTIVSQPSSPSSFSFDLSSILSITEPLGIPWHPISQKGHDFQHQFSYISFEWDLNTCTISLTTVKWMHLLAKFSTLITPPLQCVNRKTIASIHGSLQHVTLVYHQGRSHLPPLSSFLSKFPNDYVLHHLPSSCLTQLSWWHHTLSFPNPSRHLQTLQNQGLNIWLDASTSWGIGLYVAGHWAMWHLAVGWSSHKRDIGWAETVAMELSVLWLTQCGFHDFCFLKSIVTTPL